MRIQLGTVEIDDVCRRAIRWRYGEKGLATRDEVRQEYLNAGDAMLSDYAHEWRHRDDETEGED